MAANAFFTDKPLSDLGGNVVLVDQPFGGILQQPFHSPNLARKKGLTKIESLSGVKRSASTPNVRSLPDSDMSTMSMSEKRRNKLGYHRTSIACSHCRRRKIRCLLDEKDPNGRCQNCIRLKKECNFFPVDQQPPVERRPRAGSKAGEASSTDAEVSSTSSPGRPSGNVEQVEKFPQHQFGTPRVDSTWNPSFGQPTASPAHLGGSFPQRDYQQPIEGNSPWDSPNYYAPSPLPSGTARPRPDETSGFYAGSSNHPFAHSQYSATGNPSSSYPQPGYGGSTAAEERGWSQSNPQLGPFRSHSIPSNSAAYPNYQAWPAYSDPQQIAVSGAGNYGSAWYGAGHQPQQQQQQQQHFEQMSHYKDEPGHYPDIPNQYSGAG